MKKESLREGITKKFKIEIIIINFGLALAIFISLMTLFTVVNAADMPTIKYQAHVQERGWLSQVIDGQTAGTTGESKQLEAIKIVLLDSKNISMIKYRVHCEQYGWQDWKISGQTAGTIGESKRVEALQIELVGGYEEIYDIYYRMHIANKGWLGWAQNGEIAGSTNLVLRAEALQIKLVKKGTSFNTLTSPVLSAPELTYKAHIQSLGWTENVSADNVAGTTEKSLRLEGLQINLKDFNGENGVNYRAHVAKVGWQSWKTTGQTMGTVGESKAIEAVEIKLTHSLSQYFDIYYRVYVANRGWLGWAQNGATAGSTGMSLRVEAIQINIVGKDAPYPTGGSPTLSIPNLTYRAYIQSFGWLQTVVAEDVGGTIERSLRLEALQINLEDYDNNNGIFYRAHVSDIGWQDWKSSGQVMGTIEQSKAIEAVQVKLSASLSNFFDVYYRLHSADYGWLGWAKNGASAGTTGGGCRAEAIQIKLLPKGEEFDTGGTAYIELKSQSKGYYVNGVDIGYKPGDYFTDNGKACTDHNIEGIHSFFNESACNCICTYQGKSLGAVQCYGFAMYVQNKLYGVSSYNSRNSFYTIPNSSVAAGQLTASKLKSIIQSAKVGSHIRTNGSAHSMIITNITDSGFSIIQCNGANNKEYSGVQPCRIGTYTYTWNSYVSSTYGKRGIGFVEVKK